MSSAADKFRSPSDEGKAPAAAGQNSQRRSETGDGSTAASRLDRGSSPVNPSASTDERVELWPDYPGGSL